MITQCPKCGAMMTVTTAGERCPNCGWSPMRNTGWVSDHTVNLPLTIPEQHLRTAHTLETVIDDLTKRVSTLETELEKLKKVTRARDENLLEQIHAQHDSLRFVYIIRERTENGWEIVGNVCYPTFDSAKEKMKALIKDFRQLEPDYDANNMNILQVKVSM